MSLFMYEFSPTFTFGLLALALIFKIYQRSISTFVIIIVTTAVVNLNYYGYQEYSSSIILVSLAGLLIRAMVKPTNDHLVHFPYHGVEKRKKRRRN